MPPVPARWYHWMDMDAPESPWGTSPYQQAVAEGRRSTWVRWAAVLGGLLVLTAAAYGGYWYLNRPQALPVTVSIESEPMVPGSSSGLTVRVTNGSQTDVALATEVAIALPDKTLSAGLENETASSSVAVPTVAVGDIAPGGSAEVRLVLTTELDPSSAVPVAATVSYATGRDPTVRFEASARAEMVVREPAVTLSLEAPAAVVREAPFSATVRYRNNTDAPIALAELSLALPRGLTVASSAPALSGMRLALPTIPARQGGSLSLTLVPGSGAPHEMPIRAEMTAGGTKLTERTALVTVSSDALAVSVTIGGREETSVELDQTLSYQVEVRNLAKVPLRDVQVKARLGSSLFLLPTVQALEGTLSPREPVIAWTGVGVEGLRSIEPGRTVRMGFTVRLAKTAGGAASVELPVEVTATSPTVPPGIVATGVTASDTAVARLAAEVGFSAEALWRDPLGQVANAGPQPPRVGTATQYLVRWTVRPSHAGLKDAVVTASLEPGVRFTGKLGGVAASAISYDPGTGSVTWRPGGIAANTVARAAFQVEVTPATNQAGRAARLVGGSTLTATDAFAERAVRETSPALTTNLSSGAAGQGNGVVQ